MSNYILEKALSICGAVCITDEVENTSGWRLSGHSVAVYAQEEGETSDPALTPFLTLLEADMAERQAGAVVSSRRPCLPAWRR